MGSSSELRSIALSLALVGCGDADLELLHQKGGAASGAASFVCADGAKVDDPGFGRGRECLGLTCGLAPESSDCDSTATNPLKGTCVEAFFAAFQPTGTCTEQSGEPVVFTNGARRVQNPDARTISLFAPGEDTPVARALKTAFTVEEWTWMRPLD